MLYLRTIFWTSIVRIVLVAGGYVYTFFRDRAVVVRLYPSLTGGTMMSTQTGIICDLSGVNMKLDVIQQGVLSISSSLDQSSGMVQVQSTATQSVPSTQTSPTQAQSSTQQIQLFVVDANEKLVTIQRSISRWSDEIAETLKLLLAGGLSDVEKTQWLLSLFGNPQFQLLSASLDALGVLSLEFNEVQGFTNGWSARVLLMKTAIEKTARQFPQVKSVIIKPDTILQP